MRNACQQTFGRGLGRAACASAGSGWAQVEFTVASLRFAKRGWNQTITVPIESRLLCQLSYAPLKKPASVRCKNEEDQANCDRTGTFPKPRFRGSTATSTRRRLRIQVHPFFG